jgi:hypothetical protein
MKLKQSRIPKPTYSMKELFNIMYKILESSCYGTKAMAGSLITFIFKKIT